MTQGTAPQAIQVALGLALGFPVADAPKRDWPRILAAARAERLASLAWARSGALIRREAPASVAGGWRAQAVAAEILAAEQRDTLRVLLESLYGAGVKAVVLKGLPLAVWLYGFMGARQSSDIDLYVPPDQRVLASRLLQEQGWVRWVGEPPFDESFQRDGPYGPRFLEIHSILPGEALAHCRVDPTPTSTIDLHGLQVPVMREVALPAYLAGNLAKHGTPSLLAFLDFLEVWNRFDAGKRAEALGVARNANLSRCLAWTLTRSLCLPEAAAGRRGAYRLLGVGDTERTSVHALLRLTYLSDSPASAARVLGTWMWPRSLRHRPRELPAFWWRRMRRSFRQRFVYTRQYAS